MVVWLSGYIACWQAGSMVTGWLTCRCNRLAGRLSGYNLYNILFACLAGWLAGRLSGYIADWLVV